MNLIKNLTDEIKKISFDEKEITKFSILFVFVLSAVFLYEYFSKNIFSLVIFIFILIFFVGIFYKKILYPLYFIWMSFSVVVGFFVSRIILIFLFYLLIMPIGLILKIFKRDWLNFYPSKRNLSYWKEYNGGKDPRSTEKLF